MWVCRMLTTARRCKLRTSVLPFQQTTVIAPLLLAQHLVINWPRETQKRQRQLLHQGWVMTQAARRKCRKCTSSSAVVVEA